MSHHDANSAIALMAESSLEAFSVRAVLFENAVPVQSMNIEQLTQAAWGALREARAAFATSRWSARSRILAAERLYVDALRSSSGPELADDIDDMISAWQLGREYAAETVTA